MDKAFDTVFQTEVDAEVIARTSYDEIGNRFRYQCLCCGEEVYLAAADSSAKAPHFRHRRGNNDTDCERYLGQPGAVEHYISVRKHSRNHIGFCFNREHNSLIYFDPPYYKKGKQLYMNYFKHEDHIRIEETIRERLTCDWIITYDNAPEIEDIYKGYNLYLYDLNYSVSKKCKASELMIFKAGTDTLSDEELLSKGINIHIRAIRTKK